MPQVDVAEVELDLLESVDQARARMGTAGSQVDTNAADLVDAHIDLCVFAIGTLLAFGVEAQWAWEEVHLANMKKEAGIKEGRPNPYGLVDRVVVEEEPVTRVRLQAVHLEPDHL